MYMETLPDIGNFIVLLLEVDFCPWKGPKELTDAIYGCEKVENKPGFAIYSYFKAVH